MSTDLKTFLGIEKALADRMIETWRPLSADIYARMREKVASADFDGAREIAREIDLAPVGQQNREWVKYMLFAATKFGARNANPGDTKLITGSFDREEVLNRVTSNMIRWLSNRVSADVYEAALQSIAQAETTYREEHIVKGEKSPLYVSRSVLNGDELVAWAKENGFEKTQPADDLHVTVVFSKTPMDWDSVRTDSKKLTISGTDRQVKRLGDGDAIVLRFDAPALESRWQVYRDAGASWDWDGYQPHITISHDAPDLDVKKIKPFMGKILLGPEIKDTLDEDWKDKVVEKGEAVGHPFRGNQWTVGTSDGQESSVDLTLFHGTDEQSARAIIETQFKKSLGGMYGTGVYLTNDLKKAEFFGDRVVSAKLAPGLKIKDFANELEYEDYLRSPRMVEVAQPREPEDYDRYDKALPSVLKEEGFGAYVIRRKGGDYFVVPDPNDLVSVGLVRKSEQVLYCIRVPIRKSLDKEAIRKANRRFVEEFVSFAQGGDESLQLASSLHTSRLATWGFVGEAEALGVVKYRLENPDDQRTSKFCHMINGREFEVERAKKFVTEVLNADSPDDVKELQPWPAQDKESIARYESMTEEELMDEGLHIPPFHPLCRTILRRLSDTTDEPTDVEVPVEDQLPVEPEENRLPTDEYEVTQDTFREMGLEVTPDEVAEWKRLVGVNPVWLFSTMTGMEAADFISAKLASLTQEDGMFSMTASGAMDEGDFESNNALDAREGALYQNYMEMDDVADAEKDVGNVFSGTLTGARAVGANTLHIHGDGSNIPALAAAGYLPSRADWEIMTRDAFPAAANFANQLTKDRVDLLISLLNSPDPKSLRVLAALPWLINGEPVVQALFAHADFEMELDLADAESLDRFNGVFNA